MRNIVLVTLFVISFVRCTMEKEVIEPKTSVYQDERLLSLAEEVKRKLAEYGYDLAMDMNLIMTVPDSTESYGGFADVSSNSILINHNTYYNRDMTFLKLEALMLHEIGHFTYDLRHVDKKYDEEGRLQIMKQGTYLWVNEKNIDRVYSNFIKSIAANN